MKISAEIKAYFAAKKGDVDAIDPFFSENICIEDTGENNLIEGVANCKKWLKEKSQQYEMETEIIETSMQGDGIVKVSAVVTGSFAPGSFPFDYYFSLIAGKISHVKIVYTGE
jgi:hypothetical protein